MSFCLPREYEIPAVCNRISSKLSCRSAYCPATGAAPPAVPLTFAFASGAFAEWILSQTRTNNCLRLPLTTRPTAGSNELSSPLIRPGIADRLFHAPVLTSVTSRCVMYRRRNTSNSNHSPSVPANECGLKTQSADTFRSMRLTRTRSLDPGLRKVFREARVPSERLKSRKPTMPFLVQITV